MKTAFLGAIIVAVLSYPLWATGADDKGFDASKLIGEYTISASVKNGEKADADSLKKQRVTITKDKIVLKGDVELEFKYKLDTSKDPVRISMEVTKSPFGTGEKAEGIIAVNGDEVKLCYLATPQEGSKVPEKFEAKKGSDHRLVVLKLTK